MTAECEQPWRVFAFRTGLFDNGTPDIFELKIKFSLQARRCVGRLLFSNPAESCQEPPLLFTTGKLLELTATCADQPLSKLQKAMVLNSLYCGRHIDAPSAIFGTMVVTCKRLEEARNEATKIYRSRRGSIIESAPEATLEPNSSKVDATSSGSAKDMVDEEVNIEAAKVSKRRVLKVQSGFKQYQELDDDLHRTKAVTSRMHKEPPPQPLFHSATSESSISQRYEDTKLADVPVTPKRHALSPVSNRSASPSSGKYSNLIRSPSPSQSQGLSMYAENAWKTLKGDISYERPMLDNATAVLCKIGAWGGLKSSQKGKVYIVRDSELNLVKIGRTMRPVDVRVSEIARACRVVSARWTIVSDIEDVEIEEYKLLEDLVHTDLAPHRWYLDCACKSLKPQNGVYDLEAVTEHREWFDVDDEYAVATVQLWRRFLLEKPYGNVLPDKRPTLRDRWSQRLILGPGVLPHEQPGDHEIRLKRWMDILRIKVDLPETEKSIPPPHENHGSEAGTPSRPHTSKQSDERDTNTEVADDMKSSTRKMKHGIRLEKEDEAGQTTESHGTKPAVKVEPGHEQELSLAGIPLASAADLPHPSIKLQPCSPHGPISSTDAATGVEERATTPTSSAAPHGSAGAGTQAKGSEPAASPESVSVDATLERHAPFTISDAMSMIMKAPEIDIASLLRTATSLLHRKRPAIPSRTILEDLINLRWLLACLSILALCSPHVPALLASITWILFLPFLLAELRAWD